MVDVTHMHGQRVALVSTVTDALVTIDLPRGEVIRMRDDGNTSAGAL